MEVIKMGDKYLVKNSNGRIITEKEKLEMEKQELIIEDITGKGCQEKTTKKISKINKKIEAINESKSKPVEETTEPI